MSLIFRQLIDLLIHKTMKILKFGSPCPSCHKPVWKLKRIQGVNFCSHCAVQLIPKQKTDKEINFFLLVNNPFWVTIITFYMFYFFYVDSIVNFSGLNLIAIISLLLLVIYGFLIVYFDRGDFHLGVDTHEEILSDDINYQADPHMPSLSCPNCRSVRVVYFDAYKRILSKQNDLSEGYCEINKDTNLANFKGCLHCKSQYNYELSSKWMIHRPLYEMSLVVLYSVFSSYICSFLNKQFVQNENLSLSISLLIIFIILFVINSVLLSFHFFTKHWKPTLKPLEQ